MLILDQNLEYCNPEQVIDFIERNPDLIAYDVETTGLNVRKDKIIGFGISNDIEGYYICYLNYENDELVVKTDNSICVELLEKLKDSKLCAWNASFDLRFTRNFFKTDLVNNLHVEGMLIKHMVDEEQPFKLKQVASKIFGDDATEEQALMKDSIKNNGGSSKEFFKADLQIMAKYCIQDCMLTYRLVRHYETILKKENLEQFFYVDEVMPLYKEVTIPMEDRGVRVDVKALENARVEITSDIKRIEDEIQASIDPKLEKFKNWYLWKHYPANPSGNFAQELCIIKDLKLPKTATGNFSLSKNSLDELEESPYKDYLLGYNEIDDTTIREIQLSMWKKEGDDYIFNLTSKDHLSYLFFTILNEEPLTRTAKTKKPQMNDFFLAHIANKYDWAAKLQVYNKLNKIKSTYIERYLDLNEEGIFYPSWFQHRTVSGRYGGDLMQLPRIKEEGELDPLVLQYNNLVRTFFITGESQVLIDADYESLEPHIFSHVSGDNGLKNIFRNGHDFYSTIAIQTEELENVSADKKADNYLGIVDKPLRQKAKAYSLGVPYGMGDYALSKTLNISQSEARQLIEQYLGGFPSLKNWIENTDIQVKTKGFVRSQAGRVRHMPSAPKIWHSHSAYILDSLKLWKMFNENPAKYEQMKFLRKKMVNFINNGRNFQIQSLAASITNRACIKINRELNRQKLDARVYCQVHDQIIVLCEKKDSKKVKQLVEFIMCNNYKISIPLKAPAELGSNFAESH